VNPIEQWFGISDATPPLAHFADLAALQRAIHQFIAEWNETAHPFRWTARSFDKILAKVDAAIAATQPHSMPSLTGAQSLGSGY